MKYRIQVNDKEVVADLITVTPELCHFRVGDNDYKVTLNEIADPDRAALLNVASRRDASNSSSSKPTSKVSEKNQIVSPMYGTVINILVKEGSRVKKGDMVAVVEAMKMENNIPATCAGVVLKIHPSIGQQLESGDLIVTLDNI